MVSQQSGKVKEEARFHPSAERLEEYYRDGLESDEYDAISYHLARCPAAAEDALALDRFEERKPRSRDFEMGDEEMESDFEQLMRTLPPEPEAIPAESEANVIRLRRPYFWAMAASLLIAVGAVIGLVADRVGGLNAPEPNMGVLTLFPVLEAVDRDPLAEETAELSQGSFLLILNLTDSREFPQYEAVIFDWSHNELWSTRKLERRAAGHFTLALPKQFLPTGRYRLTLYGIENGSRIELSSYSTSFK
jgi:hypothetical protein